MDATWTKMIKPQGTSASHCLIFLYVSFLGEEDWYYRFCSCKSQRCSVIV